jgi:drug/metabolite transporter (DMT)-like permease
MNQLSAMQCEHCSLPFSNLPPSAFVSTGPISQYPPPPQAYFGGQQAYSAPPVYPLRVDTDLGRKTFFWYRFYCGAMMLLYLAVSVMGIVLIAAQPDTREYSSGETMIMGIVYALLGAIFFVIYLIATLLPPKPYNWIVGIVMIAVGMTSCCLWPAVIPMLIYWLKPETKAFFGRK